MGLRPLLFTKGHDLVNILQNRLRQAEFNRTVWAAQPEPGTTLEDMVKPEYWAHVAKNFKVGDRVEVVPEGAEWFAELFVRSVSPTAATVVVLRSQVFAERKASIDPGLDVKYRGANGWSVIRKSDKSVLYEKGDTREAAESFARGLNLA